MTDNNFARNESERVRNEAVRLIREREDKTVMTQRDADRRLGERLHDEVGTERYMYIYIYEEDREIWRHRDR